MISKIVKNYKNMQVEFELEYTGSEIIQYVINDDRYEPLPFNSLDQNFLTLSLPEDFEKMCLFAGSYKIINTVPDTIEFSNGKICALNLNNINKHLSVENNELVVRDNNVTDIETFLMGLESYKNQTIEKIANTTDQALIEKLETLITEIDFVIENTQNDENFPYWFYSFI